MIGGLVYKEWIKTRWAVLLLTLLGLGVTGYALLSLGRIVAVRGVAHLCEVLLSKDVLLLDALKYQPILCGLVLAVVQWAPEMVQKRLKLTLHLPLPLGRIAFVMLSYGVVILGLLFLVQMLILWGYLSRILAPELVTHLLVSVAPWFLAGWTMYGVATWVVVEPTWRGRLLFMLVGYGVVSLYFVAETPRAYQDLLWVIGLWSLLLCYVAILSIYRFKEGVQ